MDRHRWQIMHCRDQRSTRDLLTLVQGMMPDGVDASWKMESYVGPTMALACVSMSPQALLSQSHQIVALGPAIAQMLLVKSGGGTQRQTIISLKLLAPATRLEEARPASFRQALGMLVESTEQDFHTCVFWLFHQAHSFCLSGRAGLAWL